MREKPRCIAEINRISGVKVKCGKELNRLYIRNSENKQVPFGYYCEEHGVTRDEGF